MIVSDFLRAQFLATKGTRHRIRMDCLFCVVATVLCTDARCRHRLMHRRAVSPLSYAPTASTHLLILTLPLLLHTVEKTEQQVSNKRQQDSKVNLIKQIPAGLIKTSAVAKPCGKKLIC